MTAQTLPIIVGGALCALLLLGVWLMSIAARHRKPKPTQVFDWTDRERVMFNAVNNLRSMRKSCQYTKEDIARISGIAVRNLSALENQQYVPTLDLLLKYAKALDAQIHIQIRRG